MAHGIRFWNTRGELVIDSSQESFVFSGEEVTLNAGIYSSARMVEALGGAGPYFFRLPVGARVVTEDAINGPFTVQGSVTFRRAIPVSQYVEKRRFGIRFWDGSGKKTWSLEAALAGIKRITTFELNRTTSLVTTDEWFCILTSRMGLVGQHFGGAGSVFTLSHSFGGLRRTGATNVEAVNVQTRTTTFPPGFNANDFSYFEPFLNVASG